MADNVIVGAMEPNNIALSTRAVTDRSVKTQVTNGLFGRARVAMATIRLEADRRSDRLVNSVIAYMDGRVESIVTDQWPGHEGELSEVKFSLGEGHTSEEASAVVDPDEGPQLNDSPGLDNSAPRISYRYLFDAQEMVELLQKGALLPDYGDVAVPGDIVGDAMWQNMPVSFDVMSFLVGGVWINLINLKREYEREIRTRDCGYRIASMLLTDERMKEDPDRHIEDQMEDQRVAAPVMSDAEFQADTMVELDLEDMMRESEKAAEAVAETEAEAEAVEQAEAQAAVELESFGQRRMEPDTVKFVHGEDMTPADDQVESYDAEAARKESAADDDLVSRMIAKARESRLGGGLTSKAPELSDDELSVDASATLSEVDEFALGSEKSDMDLLDLYGASDDVEAAAKAAEDMAEFEVDDFSSADEDVISLDDADGSDGKGKGRRNANMALADMMIDGAESIAEGLQNESDGIGDENLSDEERKSRAQVRRDGRSAIADMMIDGARSVTEGLQNEAPDDVEAALREADAEFDLL